LFRNWKYGNAYPRQWQIFMAKCAVNLKNIWWTIIWGAYPWKENDSNHGKQMNIITGWWF
jgi:hypothetical protein